MSDDAARRWRLALGRYSSGHLPGLSRLDEDVDKVLDYLYAREQRKRGVKHGVGPGSLDPTQMSAVNWLGKARSLFPESVFATLQSHALDRYEITSLLNDPKALESLEPNPDLLKVLLGFHGRAQPEVREKLREVARKVIDDILRRLRRDVEQAFSGRRNRFRRSRLASSANFDARATIRMNMKNWDPVQQRLIAQNVVFNAREQRRLPWTVILCVDQSGSMTDSIIHSAVMAAILSGLPGVKAKMVLFDTSILDVTDRLADPLETLLSVQLGGGTNIGRAVSYCETLVDNPTRTILVLISDFCEGASPRALYAAIARLSEARVKMIGVPALDDGGDPMVDKQIAGKCMALGMDVAAMTPDRMAQWLAERMQ